MNRFPRLTATALVFLLGTSPAGAQRDPAPAGSARLLDSAAVRADLDSALAVLDHWAAYATVNGYDYRRHVDSLRAALPSPVSVRALGLALRELIGRLQDAHSDVELPDGEDFEGEDGAELPFPVAVVGGKVVALARDRAEPLVPSHPYLAALHDVPLSRLLDLAGARYRGHAPQRFLSRAARALEDVDFLLELAGVRRDGALRVTLSDGTRDTTLRIETGRTQGSLPEPIGFAGDVLFRRVAYLRIPRMVSRGEAGFEMVRAAMESREFEASEALILDVRGNGGGSRDLLEYLLPYFIAAPLVYNAAMPVGDTAGLAARGLVAPDDPGLEPAARAAAQEFARTFQPRWTVGSGRVRDRLFVAVARDEPTRFEWGTRPVIVLMDAWSFSATDVFLGALDELPHVTLLGTPSGGGSGRSRGFRLPRSGIELTVSTMASFRPDGTLYDGLGIQPDVLVERTVLDVVGRTDSQLTAALRAALGVSRR
jgi:hypothetical protein